MTKLSTTQIKILTAAAQRSDRIVWPLPNTLRGGAAVKVVNAMLTKGLIEEVDANTRNGEPVWRATGDGHGVTLIATDAGLAAIGADPKAVSGPQDPAKPQTSPRKNTKQQIMIDLLSREGGANLSELAEATQWQPQTVRGALSGALKKRLGLEVVSEKLEGRGRVYMLQAKHRQ